MKSPIDYNAVGNSDKFHEKIPAYIASLGHDSNRA